MDNSVSFYTPNTYDVDELPTYFNYINVYICMHMHTQYIHLCKYLCTYVCELCMLCTRHTSKGDSFYICKTKYVPPVLRDHNHK